MEYDKLICIYSGELMLIGVSLKLSVHENGNKYLRIMLGDELVDSLSIDKYKLKHISTSDGFKRYTILKIKND